MSTRPGHDVQVCSCMTTLNTCGEGCCGRKYLLARLQGLLGTWHACPSLNLWLVGQLKEMACLCFLGTAEPTVIPAG